LNEFIANTGNNLKGLKFVSYYGCMLANPPEMRHEKNYHGLMESVLEQLGAESIRWPYHSRCCGTFLSAVRPDVVTPMVNDIVQGAIKAGAECLVTACAMCHMNLEIRCNLKKQIPILHFSEILSLAMGSTQSNSWFNRHLVDPRPLFKARGLL
jgi:heterodisulfide reductase subunit B